MIASPGLAFLAGLASFLTPCVFSLMPAYIGYLGGFMVSGSVLQGNTLRWQIFLHGLTFVLGFSLIFIGLGMAASWIGSLLYELRVWLAHLGGILIILFGLHLTELIHISWLDYDPRQQSRIAGGNGLFSSFVMGICFSAGWSPCVGPVLGSILTLALSEGSIHQGVTLLTAYSAGFAIPFLTMALGLEWFAPRLVSFGRATKIIKTATGVVLIIVGILLFFGLYEQMIRLGNPLDLGL